MCLNIKIFHRIGINLNEECMSKMRKMLFIRKTFFLLKFDSLDVNLNFDQHFTPKIIHFIRL